MKGDRKGFGRGFSGVVFVEEDVDGRGGDAAVDDAANASSRWGEPIHSMAAGIS